MKANFKTMNTRAIWEYVRGNYDAIRKRAHTLNPKTIGLKSRVIGLPEAPAILGTSAKVEKTSELFPDVVSRVLYLSPAYESFIDGADGKRTLCPFATTCIDPCLGHNAGRQAMDDSFNARLWKTTVLMGAPKAFSEVLHREIAQMIKRCSSKLSPETGKPMRFAFRFDGSSDLGKGKRLARRFPEALFFDYTKSETRAISNARGLHPENFSQCYSFAGTRAGIDRARRVLQAGGNIAAVFDVLPAIKSKDGYRRPPGKLPAYFLGAPVFDGDEHDLLNNDPRAPGGMVRGLRFKAARDRAAMIKASKGFCVPIDSPLCAAPGSKG